MLNACITSKVHISYFLVLSYTFSPLSLQGESSYLPKNPRKSMKKFKTAGTSEEIPTGFFPKTI